MQYRFLCKLMCTIELWTSLLVSSSSGFKACVFTNGSKNPHNYLQEPSMSEREHSALGNGSFEEAPTASVLQLIQETEVRWQHSLNQLRTSEGWKSKCLSWTPLWIKFLEVVFLIYNITGNAHYLLPFSSLLILCWMSGSSLLRILVVSSPAEVACIAWAPKWGAFAFVLHLNPGCENQSQFSLQGFFFCSLQFKDSGTELECVHATVILLHT